MEKRQDQARAQPRGRFVRKLWEVVGLPTELVTTGVTGVFVGREQRTNGGANADYGDYTFPH